MPLSPFITPHCLEEILLLKNILTKLSTSQSLKSLKTHWSHIWFSKVFVRVSCALTNLLVLKLLQPPPDSAEPLQVQCLQQSPGSAQGCPKGTWESRGHVPNTWQGTTTTTQQRGANEVHELTSNCSTTCAAGTQVVFKASANYATVTRREIPRLKRVVIFFHLLFVSSPASLVSMSLWMQDKVLNPFHAQYYEFKRVTDMMKLAKMLRLLIWESLSRAGAFPVQNQQPREAINQFHII